MLAIVFGSALKDFLRPGRIWTWAAVALAVGIVARLWANFQPGQAVEPYGQVSEILVYRVLALVTAIFCMQVVSAEIEQKTIVYLLTRNVSRPILLVGRSLAALAASFGAALLCWMATGVGALGARCLQTPSFWADFGVILLGVLAYGSFFIFLSLLLNRAMIYCLLFAFGWETFVPNMPGDLYYISIYPYLKAIAAHPQPNAGQRNVFDVLSGQATEMVVSRTAAFPVLFGVIIIGFVAGIWLFSRNEYVPREDSE